MGTCMPSKQSTRKNNSGQQQKVSQKQRSKSQSQPSRLSGVFQQDQLFFKQHIDTVNGRKRLNLANIQMIDSDLTQLMRYRWIDEIQELNLQNNYITSDGYRLLISRKWPNLVVLNIAVNKVEDVGGIQNFVKLQIAYFQRNPLSVSARQYLKENNFKNGIFLCWSDNQ